VCARAAAWQSTRCVAAAISHRRRCTGIRTASLSWYARECRRVGYPCGMVVYGRCGPRGDRHAPPGYVGARSHARCHVTRSPAATGDSKTSRGRCLPQLAAKVTMASGWCPAWTRGRFSAFVAHRFSTRLAGRWSTIGVSAARPGFTLLEIALVLVVCAI